MIKTNLDILNSLAHFKNYEYQIIDDFAVSGNWKLFSKEGILLGEYKIKIQFTDKYPKVLPEVFELESKFVGSKRHVYLEGNCCLFVQDEIWEFWSEETSFTVFLHKLQQYLFCQLHFDLFGYWPEDYERKHDQRGIIDYYKEKFKCDDEKKIKFFLKQLLETKKYQVTPRGVRCPCCSKRIKQCVHAEFFELLRKNQESWMISRCLEYIDQKSNQQRGSKVK